MRSYRMQILLVGQMLFAPLVVSGQTTFAGHVYEENEPAFATSVFLVQNDSVNAMTDEYGFFKLDVADGLLTDTLVVSYLGYKDYKVALSVLKSPCVIHLKPDHSITSLSEVVVKADPTASKEFAASQIDRVSIYMTPAAGADPLKTISLQPYSTSTEESANPQLRGSSGDYSRVVINGVPIKNPVRNPQVTGIGNFSLFNAEIVDKQFVYPSNPTLEYGNSIGGIVDLRTIEDFGEKDETSLSLSLANIGVFHSHQINDKSFIQLYGNRQMSGVYKSLNKSNLEYIDKFESTDGGLNFKTALTNKSYINGYAYIVKEGYHAERGLYNYMGQQDAKDLRNFDILNYRLHTGKGVLGVNAAWDMTNSNYCFGAISDTTTQKNIFVSASYKYYLVNGLTISIGGDYEHQAYRFHGIYPAAIYFIGSPSMASFKKDDIHLNKYEIFVYGKWQVGHFLFGASTRRIFCVGSAPQLSYQASVKYNMSKTNVLIVSFGKYNALSIPSYYIRKFENATSYQMSIDWRYCPTERSEISAAFYRKLEKLPMYLINITDDKQVDNNISGVELSGKYRWAHFELSGSYSFLDAKIKYLGIDYAASNEFRYMAKGMLSYLDSRIVNLSVSCLYRGGLPYTPIVGKKMTNSFLGI